MADTLLQELSNADLDWIITSGERTKLSKGQMLLNLQQQRDAIYILVEGRFSLDFPLNFPDSNSQFLTIDELDRGEVIGIGALLGMVETGVLNTLEPSMVMALPLAKVQEKLANDVDFAAHFYRAISVMLSTRLRRILSTPTGFSTGANGLPKKFYQSLGNCGTAMLTGWFPLEKPE